MTNQLDRVPGVAASQTARASAVLPASGAYDTSPTEMNCAGFEWVTLFIKYTRGGSGGDMQFKLEGSPAGSGDSWYQLGTATNGTLSSGSDLTNNVQRSEVEYGSTGASAEKVTYGPIPLYGTFERLRVPCQESGATSTPGTTEILARFS